MKRNRLTLFLSLFFFIPVFPLQAGLSDEGSFPPRPVAAAVKSKASPAPQERVVPPLERDRIYGEIWEEKLREARDPAYGPIARRKLAELYRQAGQYDKAIYEYRFGMILNPEKAPAYHKKIGDIYEEAGDGGRARIEYELARLTRKESPASLYRRRLEEWEKEGRYDLLMQEYRFLLQTDPGSRNRYLKKIARFQDRMGDREGARAYYRQLIDFYRSLIEKKPHRAFDCRLRLAGVYEEMGEVEAAVREYDRAVETGGAKASEALVRQADFFAGRKQFDRARDLYRRAEKMEGADRASIAVKTAALLNEEGKPAEAVARLEEVASAGGREGAEAKLKMGRLYLNLGRPEKALEAYEGALPHLTVKEQGRVRERVGDILRELGRPEEARRAFLQAGEMLKKELGDEAADESLLKRLAELEEKAGRPEEARGYYEELIVVYSDKLSDDREKDPQYHRKLGDLFRNLERFDEAAAHYLAWSRLDPSNPSPYYRLSRLYRDRLKDEKLAAHYRARYRELRVKKDGERED